MFNIITPQKNFDSMVSKMKPELAKLCGTESIIFDNNGFVVGCCTKLSSRHGAMVMETCGEIGGNDYEIITNITSNKETISFMLHNYLFTMNHIMNKTGESVTDTDEKFVQDLYNQIHNRTLNWQQHFLIPNSARIGKVYFNKEYDPNLRYSIRFYTKPNTPKKTYWEIHNPVTQMFNKPMRQGEIPERLLHNFLTELFYYATIITQ